MLTLNPDPSVEPLHRCDFDPSWENFVGYTWTWIDSTISVFIPFFLIIVCNTRLLYFLLHSPYHPLLKGSMTFSIMGVCLAFILLEAPVKIDYLLQWAALDSSYGQYFLSHTIVNLLSYLSNAINFSLYFFSSPKFRVAFKAIFCRNTIRPTPQAVQIIHK